MVGLLGTVIFALPVLGYVPIKIGYVKPPSVDRYKSTSEVFMGEEVVLATFQVTVSEVSASQLTLVFGVVKVKLPELPSTDITISSLAVQPCPT